MSVRKLFSLCLFSAILQVFTTTNSYAQFGQLELVMKVSDTVVNNGDSGFLSISMDTYKSEIFGFQFVLKSNRPDLVTFDFSGTGYDIAGTLVENFEYIEVIDRALNQSEYWFRCIADIPFNGITVNGILPQQGGVALRIPFIVNNSPDTTLSLTSALTFEIPTDFSDPYGNSLGVIPDTVVDTSYYNCSQWVHTTCSSWVEVIDTSLGYEMVKYDSTVVGLLDSNIVYVIDGSVTVSPSYPTGTINCDVTGEGEINISDLVSIVQCMFIPEPPCNTSLYLCDFNDDQFLDISDLVSLVSYMFGGGPPPPSL